MGARNTYPSSVCLLLPVLPATGEFICNPDGPGKRGIEFHSHGEEITQTRLSRRQARAGRAISRDEPAHLDAALFACSLSPDHSGHYF